MKALVALHVAFVAALLAGAALGHPRGDNLSDQIHFSPEHNPEYDHEAFLGKDAAQSFDQLSHKEAQRRLSMIVDKVDANGDGQVDEAELSEWIKHVSHRYVFEDAMRQWPHVDRDGDGSVTWEEVKEATFGSVEDEDEIYDQHRQLTVKEMVARDSRRFKHADGNQDGRLDKDEFAVFLHPEERAELKGLVVDETLQDMDKDRDGRVTLQEYVDDLWPAYERKENPEEPDWVKNERESFHSTRDRNGDGVLDREELAHWVMPEGYNPHQAEARHLIRSADANKDKVLTKQEILEEQDLFVGSQATDYGDYLMKIHHDEF